MNFKRTWQSLRLASISSAVKRAEYLKKKEIFRHIGKNCMYQPRKVPLYPQLIYFHNNVRIASGVTFITHDAIHAMLNNMDLSKSFQENIGCIEICDNVFVGSNVNIMHGVRIGKNVVIAAGSVITKDIPDNTICAGVPARAIGDFDSFLKDRIKLDLYPDQIKPRKAQITKELSDLMWKNFNESREK